MPNNISLDPKLLALLKNGQTPDANTSIGASMSDALTPPPLPQDGDQGPIPPPPEDISSPGATDTFKDQTAPKSGFWSAMSNALGGGKPGDTAANLIPSKEATGAYIGGIPGRIGNAFKENFSQAPIGPGVNIISKLLFGKSGDIYNNQMTNPQGTGGESTPSTGGQQVYKQDENGISADIGNASPKNIAASFIQTPNVAHSQQMLSMYRQQRDALGPAAAAGNPAAQERIAALDKQIAATEDDVKKQLDVNKEQVKAGTRFGNFESDSKVATDADAAGKSVSTLNDLTHKIIKSSKNGDMAAMRALMQTAMDQIRPIEGVRPTGPQGAAFDAAYGHVESLLGGGNAIQAFLPQNLPGTIKAIEALRDVEAQEFDRQANKAGVASDNPLRQIYLNSGPRIDNEKVVVADANGKPKVSADGKHFIEPVIAGIDANGSPTYGDPNNANKPVKVTTIPIEYDPEKEISKAKQELEKGTFFSENQIKNYVDYMKKVNQQMGYAQGANTAQNITGLIKGATQGVQDVMNPSTPVPSQSQVQTGKPTATTNKVVKQTPGKARRL